MERLEHTVITRASRNLAWQIFSDWRRWREFSDIYGDIRWQKGEPWQPGSRLHIELVKPVQATVDHVITVCSPPEFVAWIDHTMSNTMEQWVMFDPLMDGGTRIHTWAEITGNTRVLAGRDFCEMVMQFIRGWYDRFGAACDQMAERNAVCK